MLFRIKNKYDNPNSNILFDKKYTNKIIKTLENEEKPSENVATLYLKKL
jgi:hypothetical protein|tara:strand:- start:23 stop:169 length:147 start_codon:yes stop_codon:yes gene_type:complete